MAPLLHLDQLESLSLQANMAGDIDKIGSLHRLSSLRLAAKSAADLSRLGALSNLTHLTLQANSVRDISFLENLQLLTSLVLQANGMRRGFSALSKLKHLTRLDVTAVNWDWIAQVSNLPCLEHITISGKGYVDVSPLADMKQLREISINSVDVANLDALDGVRVHRSFSSKSSGRA